jgi:hypothetical protein
MNNLSQPPQPTEPDMALLYLGSLFEPERDEAKLDALAWHILDKRPKTLLGLAIRARAEKHLYRYLWTVDFERLPRGKSRFRCQTCNPHAVPRLVRRQDLHLHLLRP